MGVRFPSVASTAIVNATLVTTAETVVATTPPLNLPLDFALVFLLFYFNGTTGATVTGVQYRLRRGTTVAGALVPAAFGSLIVGAAAQMTSSSFYVDTPGAVAGQQYSLTLTQVGATGNGSMTDVCIAAFVL